MGEAWTPDLQMHSAAHAPIWPTGMAITYVPVSAMFPLRSVTAVSIISSFSSSLLFLS